MSFWNQLVDRFRGGDGEEIDWEALLIEADLGMKLATEWVDELKEDGLARAPEKAEAFLREKMVKLVRIPPPLPIKHKPEVILLIGVNGSGKTTTAAKLGARARSRRDARCISARRIPFAPRPPSSSRPGARGWKFR